MPDGWAEMTLGEVAEVNPETTKGMSPQRRIRYIDLSAVSADSGIEESAVIEYELHSAPGRARRVVRHGDVLVSTVRPYLRGFAVVPEQLDGAVASTGFTVLRAREGLSLPGFVWSTVSKADFADRLMERATGSNYPAVRPNDIGEQVVLLPPLVVQRRVVDLVDAVDTLSSRYEAMRDAQAALARALREAGLAGASHEVPLEDLIESIEAGKSPPAEDRQPMAGEAAVLKVSAVRRGFFDATQVKVIESREVFPAHALVRDRDLLITRANTRELVGLVCRVDDPPDDLYLCDKTLRLIPRREVVSGDYLLHALLAGGARQQIENAATGTSGSMKNISQASIRAIRLPVLDRDQQDLWVAGLEAARRLSRASEVVIQRLAVFRAALLDQLLSGEREIPESYDELVGLAA